MWRLRSNSTTTMLCPSFREHGACDSPNDCRHFHPNLVCDLCGVVCRNQEFFNTHISGLKHAAMKKAAARREENGPQKCTVCNIRLTTKGDIPLHINGAKHKGACQKRGVASDGPGVVIPDEENTFECPVCEVVIWGQTKPKHARTQRHLRKERFLAIRATLDEAERDKNGVFVTPSESEAYNLGLISAGQKSLEFSVGVDSTQSRITLRSASLSNSGQHQS